MLIFYPKDWFDVNRIGLITVSLCAVLILFFTLPWWLKLLVESLLMSYLYYLIIKIKSYSNTSILISKENQWSLEINQKRFDVELKDYWVLTGFIFLLLKGSNKSVSIVLSRRIIGAVNFSQIRSKIL